MANAQYTTTSVKIDAAGYRFHVSASKKKFDGFMAVYVQDEEEKGEGNLLVKEISSETQLNFKSFEEKQHFTQPPAHYTEAALVKTLEELGIGRPSTYAPTITTIINRRYVAKENKNLYMTELGEVVNNIMVQAFPSIVDVNFTANMESLLDKVEEGVVNWKTVVSNFYPDRFIDLAEFCEIKPAVNQVETHVFNQQVKPQEIMKKYGTKVMSWGPFAEGRNNFFSNEVLKAIGERYGKSVAQVALRFLIQRDIIVIPKSTRKERMIENFDVFDFTLSAKDMEEIAGLDKKESLFFSHYDPEMVNFLINL